MIKYKNDCVNCGLPCLGISCPYRNVPHLYCDKCKMEESILYSYEDEELCQDCLLRTIPQISVD